MGHTKYNIHTIKVDRTILSNKLALLGLQMIQILAGQLLHQIMQKKKTLKTKTHLVVKATPPVI